MADPVIELSGVWKIFGPAEQAALADARAGASKADILARHVNRRVEPTAGDVRVLGQDVRALSPVALWQLRAERIGMVFQNMALMPHRTVEDHVAYLSLLLNAFSDPL